MLYFEQKYLYLRKLVRYSYSSMSKLQMRLSYTTAGGLFTNMD